MTLLTTYDLGQHINAHFNIGLESDQEIEIETEQVIIHQDLHLANEVEEVAADGAEYTETINNLDDVEEAEVTLESLIAVMESSVLRGGFDKTNATLANITLESIAMRFDFDPTMLSFGMEAVEDDAESETKSTIGKAKEMLSVLKDNTGALISKIYRVAAGALGNNAALSQTLIIESKKIKENIDATNKGGEILHLNQKFGKAISLGDNTPLAPDAYVKEFKRAIGKYNSVVKTYADTSVLSNFVADVVKGAGDKPGEPNSLKSIIAVVNQLNEGVTVAVKSPEGTEVKQSPPYLGGMNITAKRPTLRSVEEALTMVVNKPVVSQEGVGTFLKGGIQILWGGFVFTAGFIGMASGTMSGAAALTTSIPIAMLGVGVAVLAFYGARMGAQIINKGFDNQADEVSKAVNAIGSKLKQMHSHVVTTNTEHSVDNMPTAVGAAGVGSSSEDSGDISLEAAEVPFKATSLSPAQITEIANIIQNTAATTQTMKAELNKRKALIGQIDSMTKQLSKDGSNNSAMQKASAAFIKQFIKQTIKFEMDMTTYGVRTMKNALMYCQASNLKLARDASQAVEDGTEL